MPKYSIGQKVIWQCKNAMGVGTILRFKPGREALTNPDGRIKHEAISFYYIIHWSKNNSENMVTNHGEKYLFPYEAPNPQFNDGWESGAI